MGILYTLFHGQIEHTIACNTPVMEHWLGREIASSYKLHIHGYSVQLMYC